MGSSPGRDAAAQGSVTVRIIGRRVDLTVRINPLMSTPPLQEGLPSADDCPTVYNT